ncbi:hypothetical protein AAFF_G00034090 [Aldrovandia affinis]|uniref:Fucolectin tachylectin-4 pentraxin-1 domain-containing protein n=1 Tax=Aldrovandia affinis TaxID=143900 RepID=A0AAD7S3B1_9TELE|nr:hypothetical protein AAFF_G00034090 [Aldrovandia affinis]
MAEKMMNVAIVLLAGVLVLCAATTESDNVALRGKATQSSLLMGKWSAFSLAYNAIDGNRNADLKKGSCTHTVVETNPWWRVDLLKPYKVASVTITNRGDCCPERINGAEIHIGNSLENNGNSNALCGTVSAILSGGTITFQCAGMMGRYVNILLRGHGKILSLLAASFSTFKSTELCRTMGVHGLTSYMEDNRKQFFKELRLRNTTLIIDGCSLFFRLYFTSGLDQQHGGDYDSFADLVRRFFEALFACNIRPIVVLDGGIDYTDKKFATLKQRAQSKIKDAHNLSRGVRGSVLPLLTSDVFKQVLSSLQVPFIQCVFEADWEIACLANQWNCGVLTMDSDFYIFDLKGGYLPSGFFQWSNVRVCRKTSEKYISALHFSIDRFCTRFNCMNKELLPLFAAIAGNDYTDLRAMETFFSRVNFPQSAQPGHSRTQVRIDGLLRWLARFPGPEDAMDEVLRVLGGGAHSTIRALLYSGMQEYKLSHSNLARFFTDGAMVANLPEPVRALPERIVLEMCRGRLPAFVINVLVLQRTMLGVQVENCRLPSSHTASLQVRQVLYGLLLEGKRTILQGRTDQQGKTVNPTDSNSLYCVQEFDRQDLDLRGSPIQAILPSPLRQLPLENLNKVPLPVRLRVLLESLRVDESIATAVPPHLSLPVCVTCYWLTSSKPKPDLHMLQALLLGMVYGEMCRLRVSQRGPAAGYQGLRALCERLGRLRVNRGERKGPDLDVAHAYSQWQSCLWMGFYLNQLLCRPLPEPECTWLYSGTFVHRAVREMRAGSTPETLLAGPPLPAQLYSDIQRAVWRCVGADFFAPSAKKKKRGRRPARQDQGRRKGGGAAERPPSTQGMVNRFSLLVCEDEDDDKA